MNTFRDLLAEMPPAETVLADAYAAYPGRPELASIAARVTFEGLYLAARYALEGLLNRVEFEDELRADPPDDDDEDDDDSTVDYGGEGHVEAALDPSAVDLGHVFVPATDATRCCLGRDTA